MHVDRVGMHVETINSMWNAELGAETPNGVLFSSKVTLTCGGSARDT